jgi:hypothetical protein
MPVDDGLHGAHSGERGWSRTFTCRRTEADDDIIDDETRPDQPHLLLDGLSNTELKERMEHDRESIPTSAAHRERADVPYGTIVNFSITAELQRPYAAYYHDT